MTTLTSADESRYMLINNLVKAMTGYSLAQVPQNNQQALADSCYGLFMNHIEMYFKENFSNKDYIKFKAISKYDKPGLEDEDLGQKFQEAANNFFQKIQ